MTSVLVKAFWEEGKINEAVEAVRDMERRGLIGTASVYYELACCLCKNGRWQEAMVEVNFVVYLNRATLFSSSLLRERVLDPTDGGGGGAEKVHFYV